MVTQNETGAAALNGAAAAVDDPERVGRDAAARAADMESRKAKESMTLSNGIELKIRKVAPMLLRKAQAQVPEPVAPMMDGGGGVQRPNEDHPAYIHAVGQYNEAVGNAAINILILLGTEITSIPDGVQKPEDTTWSEEIEAVLEITVAPEGRKRYLDYMLYYALSDVADLMQVSSVVGQMAGLSEEDVLKAMDSFRRDTGRVSDNGKSPEND